MLYLAGTIRLVILETLRNTATNISTVLYQNLNNFCTLRSLQNGQTQFSPNLAYMSAPDVNGLHGSNLELIIYTETASERTTLILFYYLQSLQFKPLISIVHNNMTTHI